MANENDRRSLVILSGITAHNLGDDAMLVATVQELRRLDPHAKITVLAEDPSKCDPVAAQLSSLDVSIVRSLQILIRDELPRPVTPRTIRDLAAEIQERNLAIPEGGQAAGVPACYQDGLTALLRADGVLDCGGANLSGHWKSFFYEKCLDYLLVRSPLFISGQGIDPIEDPADQALLRDALGKAKLVTLRERLSEQVLESIGCTAPMQVTGDDALTLEAAPDGSRLELLSQAGHSPNKPYMAFQYRHYLDYQDSRFLDRFAAMVDEAIQACDLPVVAVPMHFGAADERDHLSEIADRLQVADRFHVIRSSITPAEAKGVFGGADLSFGISYHSAVLSLSSGTPFLGLYRGSHYTQKMKGLADLYQLPDLPVAVDEISPERFGSYCLDRWVKRRQTEDHLIAINEVLRQAVTDSRRRFLEEVNGRSPAG